MYRSEESVILTGGRLFLGRDTVAASLGMSGGRIAAIGSPQEVRDRLGAGALELDAGGATLAPGFIDSHLHLSSLGENLSAVDLAGCPGIEQMRRRVAAGAAEAPEGAWITGRGWDQDRFEERRYPTAEDLDDVAPERPVFLRRACGHAAVANTAALRAAGIGTSATDPVGGRFERYRDGRITGLLHERAMDAVLSVIPRPGRVQRGQHLEAGIRKCHSVGITSVQTNEGGSDVNTLLELFRQFGDGSDLALRAYLDLGPSALPEIEEAGLSTGCGDEFLRIGALKLFADGSLGARTALMSSDYADDPGNRGTFVLPPEEMREHIRLGRRLGMQVAIHAIGDAALDDSLELLGSSKSPSISDRIIHCQITRPEQFEAMYRAGIVACVQPRFVATDMAWAESRVGRERAATSYAWRSMLDAGVAVAGGSDAPVEPPDPILGIHAAVNRVDDDGRPEGGWFPHEKLSVPEAMELFSGGAARSEGTQDDKGRLEPGYLADLVLLDADPLSVDPTELRSISVLETWVAGRRVFGDHCAASR